MEQNAKCPKFLAKQQEEKKEKEEEESLLKKFSLRKFTVLTGKPADDSKFVSVDKVDSAETSCSCQKSFRIEYKDLNKAVKVDAPWWLKIRGFEGNNHSKAERLVTLVEESVQEIYSKNCLVTAFREHEANHSYEKAVQVKQEEQIQCEKPISAKTNSAKNMQLIGKFFNVPRQMPEDEDICLTKSQFNSISLIEQRLGRLIEALHSLRGMRLGSGCEKCQGKKSRELVEDLNDITQALTALCTRSFQEHGREASRSNYQLTKEKSFFCDSQCIGNEIDNICSCLADMMKNPYYCKDAYSFASIIKRLQKIRLSLSEIKNKEAHFDDSSLNADNPQELLEKVEYFLSPDKLKKIEAKNEEKKKKKKMFCSGIFQRGTKKKAASEKNTSNDEMVKPAAEQTHPNSHKDTWTGYGETNRKKLVITNTRKVLPLVDFGTQNCCSKADQYRQIAQIKGNQLFNDMRMDNKYQEDMGIDMTNGQNDLYICPGLDSYIMDIRRNQRSHAGLNVDGEQNLCDCLKAQQEEVSTYVRPEEKCDFIMEAKGASKGREIQKSPAKTFVDEKHLTKCIIPEELKYLYRKDTTTKPIEENIKIVPSTTHYVTTNDFHGFVYKKDENAKPRYFNQTENFIAPKEVSLGLATRNETVKLPRAEVNLPRSKNTPKRKNDILNDKEFRDQQKKQSAYKHQATRMGVVRDNKKASTGNDLANKDNENKATQTANDKQTLNATTPKSDQCQPQTDNKPENKPQSPSQSIESTSKQIHICTDCCCNSNAKSRPHKSEASEEVLIASTHLTKTSRCGCYEEAIPIVKDNLAEEIRKIIGSRKRNSVFLRFTTNKDNSLYHMQMSTDSDYLGCLYVTESATKKARNANDFDGFITLCVTDALNSSNQIDKLVDHAFMIVQQEKTNSN